MHEYEHDRNAKSFGLEAADKLGLDVPKTLDDVVEVARAFKNDDPDGNGVDDTWGLGVCNEMSDYAGYGTKSSKVYVKYNEKEG